MVSGRLVTGAATADRSTRRSIVMSTPSGATPGISASTPMLVTRRRGSSSAAVVPAVRSVPVRRIEGKTASKCRLVIKSWLMDTYIKGCGLPSRGSTRAASGGRALYPCCSLEDVAMRNISFALFRRLPCPKTSRKSGRGYRPELTLARFPGVRSPMGCCRSILYSSGR